MKVLDKETNYRLMDAGLLGNMLRHWPTVEELERSGYQGQVVIRYRQPASPFCLYGVPFEKLRERLTFLVGMGADLRLCYFNEAAPDEHLLIQGEVRRMERGLQLFYSDEPTRMRTALANSGRQVEGFRAHALLQAHLSPASWEDLSELLENYPSAVVEFSAYRIDLGWARGRNTIFWEARDY